MRKTVCGAWGMVLLLAVRGTGWCEDRSFEDAPTIVVSKKNPGFTHCYSVDPSVSGVFPFMSVVESVSSVPLDMQSRSPRGGIQTDFSLRGAGFQGVSVLLNGQRLNDPQTAHHNSDIPFTREDVERINVFPGGGSALFGADAIGGAVQIVPKRPKRRELITESAGGSHATESFLLSATEKGESFGTRFSVEQGASDGFSEDTDFRTIILSGGSWLDLPRGEAYALMGYQEKAFGAYDFYTPASGYQSREETQTALCSAGGETDVSGTKIRPAFLWRRHDDAFVLDRTRIRSAYESSHRTSVYEPSLSAEKETAVLGTVGLGMACGAEELDSSVMGSRRRARRSFFITDRRELSPRIAGEVSARRDDAGSLRRLYSAAMSIRGMVSPEQSVHCDLSRSIRIPSFTELYYADPTTRGSEGLSAEKAISYQCGYDYANGKVSADVTTFFRRERGGIDWVQREGVSGPWRAENISRADVVGVEAHYGARSDGPGPSADVYYTYLNKQVEDRGYRYKYGPNHIRHLANLSVSVPLSRWTHGVIVTYKKKPGRRGWLLTDFLVSRKFSRNGALFVKTMNVLNVEYQEIEGIPQPGRWVTAGVRLQW